MHGDISVILAMATSIGICDLSAFMIGHRISYRFLYNDYKIGHELENFCLVILFILTSIIISATLRQNFGLVIAPYAWVALLDITCNFLLYHPCRAHHKYRAFLFWHYNDGIIKQFYSYRP